MTIFQAAVLGTVQGLAECLPVSSSAHLALTPLLFGWEDQGLAYDVALHMGTLLALTACFWREWWTLALDGLRRADTDARRLFDGMVVGSVPGAVAGLALEHKVETVFRAPARIAVMMGVFGALMWAADKAGRKERAASSVGIGDMLAIGLAQALAVVPGVSRSGSTLTAGLFLGLTRQDAAKLSFMLAMPITFGAGVVKLHKVGPAAYEPAFWVGILVSAAVGFLTIKWLLGYVADKSLAVFAVYRIALAALLLAVFH